MVVCSYRMGFFFVCFVNLVDWLVAFRAGGLTSLMAKEAIKLKTNTGSVKEAQNDVVYFSCSCSLQQ